MVRLLFWLAGDCLLIYAIDRYGYWRELAALSVVVAALLWILGGALILSRGGTRGNAAGGARAAKQSVFTDAIAAAEKAREHREAAK